ncbi:MAG: DUF5677 domain-containing protein [Actinomycetota bacterium]
MSRDEARVDSRSGETLWPTRDWDSELLLGVPKVDWALVDQQIREGLDAVEIERRAVERLESEIPAEYRKRQRATRRSVTAELRRRRDRLLLVNRVRRWRSVRRLEWVWGDAIDALEALHHACVEFGGEHTDAHQEQRRVEDDFCCEALIVLFARALLTTSEIIALLRSGHGLGAAGRWRTLHEVSVFSAVIAEGSQEVAERYLLHSTSMEFRDLREERQRLEAAGDELRFDDEEDEYFAEVELAHGRLIERFGASFGADHGWAAPLFDGKPPTFKMLQERSERDRHRADYRTSSHLVHSDSWGSRALIVDHHGDELVQTGPSNGGLAAPGAITAGALCDCATIVLFHDDRDTNPDLVGMVQSLQDLAADAEERFRRADQHLDELREELDDLGGNKVSTWRWRVLATRRTVSEARWRAVRLLRGIGLAPPQH